ncbi:MAG TPA: hypothetical protein VFG81_00565 [Anaerolineales bacterium]|jgi:hypothetical protein|nr:hypothetical protein [Anaerolineales bacterium]
MSQIRRFPYLFEILAVLGLILYGVQSWYFVHSLDSIGDEGSYLYKGYMFARGDYYPFQEYTFWTNKAPLAFLIPGYIQLWFGPGLREARYFAMFVSIVMVIGVWITARRLAGSAWAALAVWVLALSAAQISIYSEALSQGLIACMLAWMFVLTLGENRPLWQLVLGSALSVVIVMTRQNMAIVPVLLVGYIFWQYGARAGWWAFGTSAVLFIAFHLFYWPGILQIWAPWLPRSITPFLDPFRGFETIDQSIFVFDASFASRLQSFANGMTDNIFVFFGFFSALILFPKRANWKSVHRFKTAVFLGATFFLLFLMHTLASLPVDYCVHCFSGYQMFYSVTGLFFLLVVFSNGSLEISRPQLILLFICVLCFATLIGLNYYQLWSDWLLRNLQIPRVNRILSNGKLTFLSLGDVFTHTLNLSIQLQKRLAAALGGLLAGGIVLGLIWILQRYFVPSRGTYALVNSTLVGCLLVGSVLPFSVHWASRNRECATRFLTYYEEAGRTLADLIPPGSQLYWRGSGRQLAFMLYVDHVKIFPPQIHAGAGYADGETQRLYRLGFFNKELDEQWRQSADILMVWDTYFTEDVREFFEQPGYEQVPFDMGDLSQCEDALYVFRKTS